MLHRIRLRKGVAVQDRHCPSHCHPRALNSGVPEFSTIVSRHPKHRMSGSRGPIVRQGQSLCCFMRSRRTNDIGCFRCRHPEMPKSGTPDFGLTCVRCACAGAAYRPGPSQVRCFGLGHVSFRSPQHRTSGAPLCMPCGEAGRCCLSLTTQPTQCHPRALNSGVPEFSTIVSRHPKHRMSGSRGPIARQRQVCGLSRSGAAIANDQTSGSMDAGNTCRGVTGSNVSSSGTVYACARWRRDKTR